MLKRAGVILVCLACGCGKPAVGSSAAPPEAASTVVAVAVGSAVTAPLQAVDQTDSAKPPPKLRCEPMPLKLVVEAAGRTSTVMQMSATGEISGGMLDMMRTSPSVRLDRRGCVVGQLGGADMSVWMERTSASQMWSPRALIRVEGKRIFPAKHSLTIEDDGRVVNSLGPDNSVVRFEGYEPKALCAAQLMLMSYLSMMPSMAVVDGAAEMLSPPTDSVCPELHPSPKP